MYIRFMENGYELTLPEGLRISDGPRMSVREVPWPPGVHFYKVTDLETGRYSYCTSVETALKVGRSLRAFRRAYNRKRKENGVARVIFGARYHITRVPKMVFIQKTGRKYDEVREYFYRY